MPSQPITAAAVGTWTLADRTVHRMGFGSMRVTANPDRDLAVTVLRRAVELSGGSWYPGPPMGGPGYHDPY